MSKIKTKDELDNSYDKKDKDRVRIKTQDELEKTYQKSDTRIKTAEELEEEYQNNRYFPSTQSKPKVSYSGVGKQSISDSIRKRNEEQQAREDAINMVKANKTAKEKTQEDLDNLPEGAYEELSKDEYNDSFADRVGSFLLEHVGYTNNLTGGHTSGNGYSDSKRATALRDKYGMDEDTANYYAENWKSIQANKEAMDQQQKQDDAISNMDEKEYDLLETYAKAKSNIKFSTNISIQQSFLKEREDAKNQLISDYGLSEDEIAELSDYVERDSNKKYNDELSSQAEEAAQTGVGRAALRAAALGVSPIAGAQATLGSALQKVTGKPIDIYGENYLLSNLQNSAETATSEAVEEKYGKEARFINDVLMSVGESAETMALGSNVAGFLGLSGSTAEMAAKIASYPLFSSSAFASTLRDKVESGQNDDQAFAYAVATGVAEGLFEEISFDNLQKTARATGKVGLTKTIKNLLKQGLYEGSEEVNTDIANAIADALINADYSDYNLNKETYLENGYSEADATRLASEDLGKQIIEDGLAGAISGAIMGTGASVVSYHNFNSLAKSASDNTINKAAETALNSESAKDSTAREIAQNMQNNNQTASDLSTRQKSQMLESLAQLQDEEIDNSINKALESRIENKDTLDKAKSLFDEYRNSDMTNDEFEEKLVNEVAKNSQERDAILEARDEAFSVNSESNPIVNTMQQARTDRQIDIENKAIQKEIAKQDKAANKNYAKFEKAVTSKEKYKAAKGVAQAKVKEGKEEASSKVLGVYSLKGGENTTVMLEGGKTASLKNVTFSDQNYGKLYNEVASSLSNTDVANKALQNYQGQEVESYVDAYRVVYELGRTAARTNKDSSWLLNNALDSYLVSNMGGASAASEVFYRGKNDAENYKAAKESVQGKQENKTHKNKSNAEDILKGESEIKHLIAAISDKTGVKINEINAVKDNNGNYNTALLGSFVDNVITLNSEGKNELQTLIHEVMEKMKSENQEGYNLIVNQVIEYVQSTKGSKALIDNLQKYQRAYAVVEGLSSTEDIADEYSNDFVAGILTSPEGLQDLATWASKENPKKAKNLFEAIADFFNRILDEITRYMDAHKSSMNQGARDGFEATGKQIEDLRKTVFAELDKMGDISNQENKIDYFDAKEVKKNLKNVPSNTEYLTDKDVMDYIYAGNRRKQNRLDAYKAGEKIIITNRNELIDFFDNTINKQINLRMPYTKVSKKLASKVLAKDPKLNLEGMFVEVESHLYHSYKDHHDAKENGDLPMSIEEMIIAVENVNDADVEIIEKHGDKTKLQLSYGKDSKIIMIEVVSKAAGSITFTNSWNLSLERYNKDYNKNKNSRSTSEGINPGTEHLATASNDIVSNTDENATDSRHNKQQNSVDVNQWTDEEKASFKFEDNGNVRFMDGKYISNDLWQTITKEFKKLGYDFKDWKHTKEYYTNIFNVGNGKGILLNDDQAAVINKLFNGEAETEQTVDNTEKYKDIAKKAEKKYGVTSNWDKAAYLTVNGKLLDFSDGQSYRVKDHREISEVLDLPEDAGYSDGLIEFMKEGNIRLQTYGIDIAVKPNKTQRSMLRTFFNKLEGEVTVDFSRLNGDTAGSAEYTEGTASTRILNDIDSFFETGEVPQGTYDGNTYFSVNVDSETDKEYLKLADDPKTNKEKLQKMVDEVASKNGYTLETWHGTKSDPFTVFKSDKTEINGANRIKGYFSDQEEYASGYGNAKRYYLKLENPLYVEGMENKEEMTRFLKKKGITGVEYNDFISNEDEVNAWLEAYSDFIDPWMFFNENGGNITEKIQEAGYDGVEWSEGNFTEDGGTAYMPFNESAIKSAEPVEYDDNGKVIPLSQRFNDSNPDTRFSVNVDSDQYAPVFYSKMENEISGIKTDKIGAASLIPYLKGKGVKDEEIKWSGIATFLEGKKSVTKQELQEFLKANELVLEEETFDSKTQNEMENLESKLIKKAEEADFYYSSDDYIEEMDGSFRYSKLIEDIEEAFNDDQISKEDESSLLSIANEMRSKSSKAPHWSEYKTDGTDNYREILFKIPESDYTNQAMRGHWNTKGVLAHTRLDDLIDNKGNKILFVEEIQSDWHNAESKIPTKDNSHIVTTNAASGKNLYYLVDNKNGKEIGRITNSDIKENNIADNADSAFEYALQKYAVPEAPYANGKYVEYVMKRLLRMAAEGNYDSIGWTTGKMQEDRWSSRFAEGYRIEYDQDIPKFMDKYGKQWGAKVEKETVKGNNIWKVDITPEMKQSVLFEGQAKFSVDIPEYDFPRTVFFKGTDEEIAAAEAKEEEIKDVFRNIVNQPDFQALRVKKEGYKYPTYYILHHSTRPGMEYQLSYYDKNGPIGHAEFIKGDEEEMYKRLLGLVIHEKNAKVEVLPEDIENRKFSVEVDDDLSLFEAIIAENEQIKEASNVIANTAKDLGKLNIKEADIKKIASSIKAEYKTNVSVDDIAENLTDVFNYMNQDNVNYDALVQIMSEVAKPLLENATTTTTTRSDAWNKFSEYLRSSKIKLTNGQIREVVSKYGNTENYRKRLFGITTISKDAPMSLEEMWSELVDASGNILPADVAAENQPVVLMETIEGLKPKVETENTYGMNIEQASYDLALDIYRRFFEVQAQNNKSAEIREAVGKVKTQMIANRRKSVERYQQKLEEQKKLLEAEKQKNIKALANEIKENGDALQTALSNNDEVAAAIIEDLKNKNEKKLEQVRKQRDDQIAKIKAKNFDARLNEREKRKNTVLKEQLRNQTNALNKMLKSPNVAAFVKVSMVNGTIDVLKAINLDTGKSQGMKDKLQKLSELYARYQEDSTFNFDYDQNTQNMINELRDTFEGRNYTELSNDELQKVVELVSRLKTQIQNANKQLQNEKYNDASKAAISVINEVNASKGSLDSSLSKTIDKYLSYQLNAYRWFRKTSGYKDDGALMDIYNQLDKGQMKMLQMQKEINEMFAPLLEGKENQENVKRLTSIDEKDLVDIGLKVDGKPFKVTRGMMLSYLMHVQNDGNARHLVLGGFTIPDFKAYSNGKISDAFEKTVIGEFYSFQDIKDAADAVKTNKKDAGFDDGVNAAIKVLQGRAKKIRKGLSEWEEAYLETAEKLFHEYYGEKINEVSVETRGYALAQVKNYYPIKTDKKFTRTEFAALKQDGSLEGLGFLKERVKAANPIMLEDISNVILRQTDNTSRYYGFSIPVRNVNMVMNMRFNNRVSPESAISDKWGSYNLKLFEKIMQDVQTGRGTDSNVQQIFSALRGNFAAATLTANIGVAMKQAASYPTAAAVIGWKPLGKALNDISKGLTKNGIQELEEINPLLWYRSKGQSSADINYAKQSGIYKYLDKKAPIVKAISVDLIQNIDSATVRTLEYASKYYVDENFKDLEKGSEEYWNKVSETFTKVVEETQPNYTVLQRPEVLKDTDSLVRQLFMFKTQPLQNLGIVYDALGEYNTVKKKYAKDSAKYKAAVDKVSKAVSSQLVAAVVFSAMTVLSNVLYHKIYKYDQDDDKSMIEEAMLGFAGGIASTLSGMLICGDWIYNAVAELLFGAKNYGVEVSIVEGINNAIDYINNYKEYSKKLVEAETEAETETYIKKLLQNSEDVAVSIGQFVGMPVNNIKNSIISPFLYIKDVVEDVPLGSSVLPWDEDVESQYMRIYEALIDGDKERYTKLYNQQVKASDAQDPEKSINNKIKNMLREAYDEKEITAEQVLKYLDEAGIEYDSDLIDSWDYENETGSTSYSKYSRMNDAIRNSYENGADRSAITTEIKKLLKAGTDKGDIASMITKNYKSTYLKNKSANLKNLLITCYMACGYTRDEAIKRIDAWSK